MTRRTKELQQPTNYLGEGFAELVELLLQRRVVLLLRGLLDLALDLADLGGHADGVDHRHAAAVGDRRCREQHVLLALQLAVLLRQMRRVLHGAGYSVLSAPYL